MKNSMYLLILALFIVNCKEETPKDPIPLHDSLTVFSKQVEEDRIINIWTPPSYETSNINFPVLYMPDGGIKEDFPHIANTIAKLVEDKSIPPMILVGIENTERGRDLTGFSEVKEDEEYCPITDGAKNFRAFITQELMPQINEKYRTNDKKGIIGESLAGLFVMETFFLTPNSFDYYIAIDPSLWWNNNYLEKMTEENLQALPDTEKKLWFAGSSTIDISKYTKSISKKLQDNAPNQLTWKYSDEPNEEHHTILRATKEKALIWTFSGIESH